MRALRFFVFISLLAFCSCSSLILKPADFAWPVESVQQVNDSGMVVIPRYSFSFNAKPLFTHELKDSLAYRGKEVRVIRGSQGCYFMIANGFKNVYVFNAGNGGLKLEKKIEISDTTGIQNPAFNQRPPYVQLNYNGKNVNLNKDGIVEEGKK